MGNASNTGEQIGTQRYRYRHGRGDYRSIELPTSIDGVPVYTYGGEEARRIGEAFDIEIAPPSWYTEEERQTALAAIPACIIVGKFDNWVTYHVGGADGLEYGCWVNAYRAGGEKVYSGFAAARGHYEPDTTNKIGGMGAYRDLPDSERITAQITRARAALAA